MDPEIGYTQGMNFIVYILIKYIDNEELIFWCLYDIMYNKNWRLILKDGTPKLKNLVKSCRSKIYDSSPKMYKKLAKCKVPFYGVFASYYISIFANKCPIDIVARIFDVFLFEGESFITQVIVNLYTYNKANIMAMGSDDMNMYLSNSILADYLKSKPIESLFQTSK